MPVRENGRTPRRRRRRRDRRVAEVMRMLIVAILLLLGITFIASTLVITRRTRRDYNIRESETTVSSVGGSITAAIGTYKEISRLIMLNEGVTGYLRAASPDVWLENDARDGAVSVLNVSRSVDSVFIFRNDGAYVSTGKSRYDVDLERMAQPEWRSSILDERGGAVVFMNCNGAIFRSDGAPIITIARAIYDINSQKQTGILLMNISDNMLSRITRGLTGVEVSILTAEGELLAGSVELGAEYNGEFNSLSAVSREVGTASGTRMVSGCAVEETPFVILASSDTGSAAFPGEMIAVLLVLLLVFLAALILSGALIMRHLNQPIMQLAAAMERTKDAGWPEKLDLDVPNSEIGVLTDSYNSMVEHLNDLLSQVIENEKTAQRAELRVLYEQIKPHFLYNSLEAISYMAMEAGAEEVYSALETLGSFYRNFLSKGSRVIPLRRELRIVQDYLSLQKLRYGDILRDEYEIEDGCLDCMVPKLILQPLVENSIYHGIKRKGEEGLIRVTAGLAEDRVRITVRDTGVGMTEEEIEQIMAPRPPEAPAAPDGSLHGFGLRGTIERLRHFSGEEDVLHLRSVPGEYTEVALIIPAIREVPTDVQSDDH